MKVEPRKEHRWLQKPVGEWTFDVEAMMGSDKPPEKFGGSESVRDRRCLDTVRRPRRHVQSGATTTLMTLGYDPQKKQYVGTWIGSM